MTGEFVELKDESLKECFTYKKITFKKSIPWKFKENLYLVEIDDKKTGQLAAIATLKKYKPEAFVPEFRLAATGGLPYTDKADKKKFIQMFIECKN